MVFSGNIYHKNLDLNPRHSIRKFLPRLVFSTSSKIYKKGLRSKTPTSSKGRLGAHWVASPYALFHSSISDSELPDKFNGKLVFVRSIGRLLWLPVGLSLMNLLAVVFTFYWTILPWGATRPISHPSQSLCI